MKDLKHVKRFNEATENLNISDVSDSVYFIRVSVKIPKSFYNRTADIKDIVRTELNGQNIGNMYVCPDCWRVVD